MTQQQSKPEIRLFGAPTFSQARSFSHRHRKISSRPRSISRCLVVLLSIAVKAMAVTSSSTTMKAIIIFGCRTLKPRNVRPRCCRSMKPSSFVSKSPLASTDGSMVARPGHCHKPYRSRRFKGCASSFFSMLSTSIWLVRARAKSQRLSSTPRPPHCRPANGKARRYDARPIASSPTRGHS